MYGLRRGVGDGQGGGGGEKMVLLRYCGVGESVGRGK